MNQDTVIIKAKEILSQLKQLLQNVFEKNGHKRILIPAQPERNRRNGICLRVDSINDRGVVTGIAFKRKHF